MRVLIVGAGAVGSFLGWAIAVGGGEVSMVRRGSSVSVREEPFGVVRPDGSASEARVKIVASVDAAMGAPDLVVVAVKQYDLPAAFESLRGWPRVPILTVQNGVGAEEAARAARPGAPVLAGSVTASVERNADGSVRWLRRGGLGLAVAQGAGDELVRQLSTIVAAAGVPVRILPDAAAMKWSKLVSNLVGNATSGLLDLDPASIYRDGALFDIEHAQLREALAVMRAKRLRAVALPGAPAPLLALATSLPAPLARAVLARVVGSARGGKDPSLRGAVKLGAPTEVGWLNGAVARGGAETGVPTPVNAALARLVDEVAAHEGRRAWFRHRPDRLRTEVLP